MGSFKEIGDLLKDAKGVIKSMTTKATDIRGNSIARQSSTATLQFPIIVSRSINVDTASSIVKAMERQYATYVQMVIALNPVINWDEGDISAFINKIHQNNPTPLDVIESCTNVYTNEEYNLRLASFITEGCNGALLRSNKEQLFCIEDHLNPYKLNDLYKPKQVNLSVAESTLEYYCKKNNILMEAKKRPKKEPKGVTLKNLSDLGNAWEEKHPTQHFDPSKGYEPSISQDVYNTMEKGGYKASDKDGKYTINGPQGSRSFATKDEYEDEINKIYQDLKNGKNPYSNEKPSKNSSETPKKIGPKPQERKAVEKPSNINSNPNKDKGAGNGKPTDTKKNGSLHENEFSKKVAEIDNKIDNKEQEKREEEAKRAELMKEIERDNIRNRAKAVVKLHDNDIKKCNELVPTTLAVTLQQIKGDNFGTMLNFILGIKGLMHPVTSEEMVSNLLDGHKAGNKFFNFLRWTSGEISFLKDLIFNVDGIKDDVIKKHNKGSHWWTTLKRNRTLARMKNVYGKNRILPNATIVCSMEEMLEMKDVYAVDLMDPKNAMKIMDRYFLLGFVVVDESQELCYFMFDGEREFHAMSFKGLDRENNNKNDFKDIYKMINSGRL